MNLLHLTRPLVCLDVESTGTNPETDRVIELGLVRLAPDGARTTLRWLVHPGRPIPADSSAVHGILDVHVEGAPVFADVAAEITAALADVDLVGFNLRAFDLPILRAEFARAGMPWPCQAARVLDVFCLYRARETRTLTDAVRFYLGRSHEGAHSAVADAEATLDILRAQLGRYVDLPTDVAALDVATGGRQPDWATECGKLRWNADGACAIAFGKSAGIPLSDCDPGYLRWILSKGPAFGSDMRDLVTRALRGERITAAAQ